MKVSQKITAVPLLLLITILAGCSHKAEPINFGKDSCAECKMTIVDPRFGGEIVTKKGKIYKFDDAHCVAVFMENRRVEMGNIHKTYFVDFNTKNKEFIKVNEAEFVVSSKLNSPMGGNAAAFRNKQEAEKQSAALEGSKVTNWATLYNILIK